jgi:tetrapyrrole methylase family protein / MazG family protein
VHSTDVPGFPQIFSLHANIQCDIPAAVPVMAIENSAEKFIILRKIMAKLRSDNGCPWDREQNHQTLRPYLMEETCEALETIDLEDWPALAEELGDVLLQIVFHAQVGEETGTFTMDDILDAIIQKLIRRHPHVFGDVTADSADQVLKNWRKIKETEKEPVENSDFFANIPKPLPQLMYARKIQDRAAEVGFDWDSIDPVKKKLVEEWNELTDEMNAATNKNRIEEEFGDMLFAMVNLARFLDIEPEEALRSASRKFKQRFRKVELNAGGRDAMRTMTLDQLDAIWNEIKKDDSA